MNSSEYLATIEQVKQEIKSAQYRAAMHVNADLVLLYHSNLDGLLFTGRLFACIPDIENELDAIMADNTNTITCRDCIAMKGANRTNTAACGMAMEALALHFGAPDLSWPDIEKARNVSR